MVNRAILDIEINAEEFDEFKRKFDAYTAALKTMPQHWKNAGQEIIVHKTYFEKLVAGAGNLYHAMERATIAQSAASSVLDTTALTLAGLTNSGKLFRGHIHHATQSLMRWTKLTAVFSGILGAGGLFGINRMAASVAAQRTSAAGLGVTYGEQASFLTNFQRLGNAEGILAGFSQVEAAVNKNALRQYLGHEPSGDPARDFAEGLGRFKDFVEKTPHELLGPMLQARGYDQLGLGVEQANIIGKLPRSEIEQISKSYGVDLATRLGLPPDIAKKWTAFTEQINRAGNEIETKFAKGTVTLINPLTHLSESFVSLTENLLKGGPIAGWIKKLGKGIKTFAEELASGSVQAKAASIGKDISDVVKLFDAIIAKWPSIFGIGATGLLLGRAGMAAGTALAGAVGTGALVGASAIGGAAVGMNKAMPQHPERLRRRQEYENAGGSPTSPHPAQTRAHIEHEKLIRHRFGHPAARHKLTPGAAQIGAAEPGTPWNREFQPHKGKRGVVSSHEFYKGLIARGATPAAAAALTGNAAYESGSGSWDKIVLDPATDAWHKDFGTGDAAVGAFQWEGRRKRGVRPTIESETQHAVDELKSGEQRVTLEELNRIRDPSKAAAVVNRQYERPLHPSASMSARQHYAAKIFAFEKARDTFGHPRRIGHHPANIGKTEKPITIDDHTGGLVTIGAH